MSTLHLTAIKIQVVLKVSLGFNLVTTIYIYMAHGVYASKMITPVANDQTPQKSFLCLKYECCYRADVFLWHANSPFHDLPPVKELLLLHFGKKRRKLIFVRFSSVMAGSVKLGLISPDMCSLAWTALKRIMSPVPGMWFLCPEKSSRTRVKDRERRMTEVEWIVTVRCRKKMRTGLKMWFSQWETLVKVTLRQREPLFLFSNFILSRLVVDLIIRWQDLLRGSGKVRQPTVTAQFTSAILEAFFFKENRLCVFRAPVCFWFFGGDEAFGSSDILERDSLLGPKCFKLILTCWSRTHWKLTRCPHLLATGKVLQRVNGFNTFWRLFTQSPLLRLQHALLGSLCTQFCPSVSHMNQL